MKASDSLNLDKELETLAAEHAALEAEENEPPPVPTWHQLQDSGAVVELEQKVARRGILGHLKRANLIRQRELEAERYRRQLGPLREEQGEAYPALERKRAELAELQREVNVASGEFSQRMYRIQELERRVRLLHRETEGLRGAGNGS